MKRVAIKGFDIIEMEGKIKGFQNALTTAHDTITDLRQQLKEMRSALEFYTEKNWMLEPIEDGGETWTLIDGIEKPWNIAEKALNTVKGAE